MKKPISHFFELKKKQIDTFLAASPHPSGGTGKNDRCAGGTLKIQHRFSVKNTLLNGEHYNEIEPLFGGVHFGIARKGEGEIF